MLSPAVVYLRIKLSNKEPGAKPDSGVSFSAGIKPEDDLGYEVMSGDKPMMMTQGQKPRKPGMSMGGKPGMSMGGKPDMSMGGKKPGMSMKDQIGMAMAAKGGMPSSSKDMEITPEEMEASNVAEQSGAGSRLPSSMGFLANTFR